MKGTIAIIVGFLSGGAFVAGWILDPGPKVTLVTTLMCGMATILIQLTGRDLVSRAQVLIDRGADDSAEDGGELYSAALRMKDRVEKLLFAALASGVVATAFAALRVLDDNRAWSAIAFACAVAAVVISSALFAGNRALGSMIDSDRVRRARKEAARQASLVTEPFDASAYRDHPNLKGYPNAGPGAAPAP
jgi:hypothetical protein